MIRHGAAYRTGRAVSAVLILAVAVLSFGTTAGYASANGASSVHATKRTVQFKRLSPYVIAIQGRYWPASTRLVIAIRAGRWTVGREVKTSHTGTFLLGVKRVQLCGGVDVQVDDFNGHEVAVRSARLRCLSLANFPKPTVKILQGTPVQVAEANVIGTASPRPILLRVGDRLSFFEGGAAAPEFRPHPDATYLLLLEAGPVAPRSCSQPNCEGGFMWTYVAVRAGDTTVDMSPGCRDSTPQCGRPDIGLMVNITE